jgi:hypothetical protein
MTLRELIWKKLKLILGDPILDYKIELFDQDDWQYEITEAKVCEETRRVIITLQLIGEKKDVSKNNLQSDR